MMFRQNHDQGFAILEVLIAVVVLAIGLLGIAGMQANVFRSAGDAKARSIASALAQEKLDDLRSYGQIISGTGGTFGWEEIADNTGGAKDGFGVEIKPSKTLDDADASLNISGVQFSRTWTALNHYFPPITIVGPGATAVTSDNWSESWGTLPSIPDYKEVTVTISWTNPDATQEQVALTAVINQSDPQQTGRVASETYSATGPTMPYSPGAAPEVAAVPFEVVDGRIQEASKPLPTVIDQAGTTMVRIDEVVYDSNTDTQWRNASLTLNCVCSLGREDAELGRAPTVIVNRAQWLAQGPSWNAGLVNWVGDADVGNGDTATHGLWVLGDEVAGKTVGAVATGSQTIGGDSLNLSKQPEICDVCCRDHHDYSSTYPLYDPLRPAGDYASGNHKHYFPDGDGNLAEASAGGDLYLESCRMIRLDGHWRVNQDWLLQEVNLIPESFLSTDAGLTAYQVYAKSYLENYLQAAAASYPPTNMTVPTKPWSDTATLAVGGSQPFLARGIYVDYMGSSVRAALDTLRGNGDAFMARLPFHEVNVTYLANWSESELNAAIDITSEAIDSTSYSRGLAQASDLCPELLDGQTAIELSNTGLTDTRAIDPDDDINNGVVLWDTPVEDLRDGVDTVAITVTGTSSCGGLAVGQYVNVAGHIDIDRSANDISVSDLAFSAPQCTVYTTPGDCSDYGTSKSCYVCEFERDAASSFTVTGYNKTVDCGQGNTEDLQTLNNEIVYDGVVNSASSGSGTEAETTTISFAADTLAADVVYDLTVQGPGCL